MIVRYSDSCNLSDSYRNSVGSAHLCYFQGGFAGLECQPTSHQTEEYSWNSLCLLLKIKHQPTTAYHPQANRMVKRLHRRLKDTLRAHGDTSSGLLSCPGLDPSGPPVNPREDTNISPAQALYGTPLVLPNQYLSINNNKQ
jgi:hypothetical protein